MDYYIVDAFSDKPFGGNQAGVCLLDEWLEDGMMRRIAAENNLSETAFVVPREGHYDLRWFSPTTEIDLCGHGTLASAFVVAKGGGGAAEMDFHTKSGVLRVKRVGDLFEMDFPSRPPKRIAVTPLMAQAVGAPILEAYMARDMLLLLEDAAQVRDLRPDLGLVAQLPDCFGLIVTAKGGDGADFVSRFFAPNAGMPEDPVTGSSHSTLIPFWADRLGKQTMTARQLSKRGGTLYCENRGGRVKISGGAALYMRGKILV